LPVLNAQTLLLDNFTSDTALDASLWTNQAPVLDALDVIYGSEWLAPTLSFGPSGMQMSGINAEDEFAALASVQTYSPPLTLSVTVEGIIANGNPFEILLVNDDLSCRMSVTGNLNSANTPFYGIKVNYTGSGPSFGGGDVFFGQPTTNTPYTVQLSVDETGTGTALLADTNGVILALETELPVGTAAVHVVLAQREGQPNTVGTNIAIWNCASVVSGSIPPVQVAPTALQSWTASGFTMMLQGPIGSNYLIETSIDLRQWSPLTNIISTNTPFFFHDSQGGNTRFYRAKLDPN
jgi:hypothetical protein